MKRLVFKKDGALQTYGYESIDDLMSHFGVSKLPRYKIDNGAAEVVEFPNNKWVHLFMFFQLGKDNVVLPLPKDDDK